jgi:hypothetical protein
MQLVLGSNAILDAEGREPRVEGGFVAAGVEEDQEESASTALRVAESSPTCLPVLRAIASATRRLALRWPASKKRQGTKSGGVISARGPIVRLGSPVHLVRHDQPECQTFRRPN